MRFADLDPDVLAAARRVRLLLMDCDGVLTDGRLYFSNAGETMKVFNVRDGQGLASWHRAGFRSGVISGRGGKTIIEARAAEVGIEFVRTNSADKVGDLLEIASAAGVPIEETAFVGDDIGDAAAMTAAGFSVAVADAVEEVRRCAALITNAPGGHGAIREVTDLLLKVKGCRDSGSR